MTGLPSAITDTQASSVALMATVKVLGAFNSLVAWFSFVSGGFCLSESALLESAGATVEEVWPVAGTGAGGPAGVVAGVGFCCGELLTIGVVEVELADTEAWLWFWPVVPGSGLCFTQYQPPTTSTSASTASSIGREERLGFRGGSPSRSF